MASKVIVEVLCFIFQKLGFIGLNFPVHELELKKSNLARTAVTQVVSYYSCIKSSDHPANSHCSHLLLKM